MTELPRAAATPDGQDPHPDDLARQRQETRRRLFDWLLLPLIAGVCLSKFGWQAGMLAFVFMLQGGIVSFNQGFEAALRKAEPPSP